MAFGFFKKKEYADLLLKNGKIYTQDPQMPWAEAVAVKGERVMAVGDSDAMDSLANDDTEIIDLEGKYVFPGFIDAHHSPTMKVLYEKYADLSDCDTVEEVIETLSDWAQENPENEIIFGYGYKETVKPKDFAEAEAAEDSEDESEEAEGTVEIEIEAVEEDDADIDAEGELAFPLTASAAALDEEFSEKPVVLLSANTVSCWTNSAADKIILETAAEECVQTVTANYILNLLLPFDFEELEEEIRQKMEELSDKGYTSVLDLQAPSWFQGLYQDAVMGLYNEGTQKQRFFGTHLVTRPLIPRSINYFLANRKTTCIELGDLVHANTLNLYVDNEKSPMKFSQNALNQIMEEVSDKGFDIFVDVRTTADLKLVYNALEHTRGKGYKNNITIASDATLSDEDTADLTHDSECIETWGTCIYSTDMMDNCVLTPEEAIEELTVTASQIIGMADDLGSIEKGKLADMAIFKDNLLELDTVRKFNKIHSEMTIMNGQVVYDSDDAFRDEMWDLMIGQHI